MSDDACTARTFNDLLWLQRQTLRSDAPADHGGALTPERIDILRQRAVAYAMCSPFTYTPSHGPALLDALDEVETLRAALDAAVGDMDMLARVALPCCYEHAAVIGSGDVLLYGERMPAWLRLIVEQGHADALQADRATVAGVATCGWEQRLWYRHGEAPRAFDKARYMSALRVVNMLRDVAGAER